MFRHSIVTLEQPVYLLHGDKTACKWITHFVVIQCLLAFVGSATIQSCLWSPEHATYDYDKLARIMYLFDSQACGYNLRASRSISNLQFDNDTHGLDLLPIKWMPAIVTVSTRLSAKTRRYIDLSIGVHVVWLLSALALRIMHKTKQSSLLKLLLGIFFYVSVSVIAFDLSMAIVYVAHIQQSLTKGMILRYSGWSVEMKLKSYDDFGGWLPMVASVCWMRGIIILGLNIYSCRAIRLMRKRIKKSEVKKRLVLEENPPIPEAKFEGPIDDKVLYYRTGEHKPYVKKNKSNLFY